LDLKNYHDKLFPYAYNILGSSHDAKDAVQEVLVKYLSIEKSHVENETGFLIKSVINLSINIKNKNKNSINNVWLPEPYSTENADDNIRRDEVLSYSILVLLEKLTAKERAVFILKEAFDYSHKEIAIAINLTIENSRKILSRTKNKLLGYKEFEDKNQIQNEAYLTNYMRVIKLGDVDSLEKFLSKDILLAADGGTNIRVVRELTTGKTAVVKLLFYVHEAFLKGLKFKISRVNHQPAILFYREEVVYNCQVFEVYKNKILNIYSIVDPEKLKSLF
jgi:RNA polymerase sigma-70 factor (ECF subfamily)